MDFVTIVTPNRWHFEPAMMALEGGFHVVVDKPMTFSLEEAKLLQKKVEETGLILALTHVYSGYPAVKDMKARIAAGELGKIRRVYVEYCQGWLSERIELQGGNNAGWRTDPKRSGKAGCVGDIGTHAWHLSEYVTGQKVTELCGDLTAFVPNRPIDDDGTAFLKYDKGAKGVLVSSQIDPSRAVQYEQAHGNEFTDIYCPMYLNYERSEKYCQDNPSKPLIQCEYAHAMGNSQGGFMEYWDQKLQALTITSLKFKKWC